MGLSGFLRTILMAALCLFIAPLLTTVVGVLIVSGGFALWQHSSAPLLWGLIMAMPTYLILFFVRSFLLSRGKFNLF